MNSLHFNSRGPAGLVAGAMLLFGSPFATALAGENGPRDPVSQIVVGIEAVNASTPEYCPPNARCAPGRFLIRRTGSPSRAQEVFLFVGGTAEPDVDYDQLPVSVTIPAGSPSVEVLVAARDDNAAEGDEAVVAKIAPWLPQDPDEEPPDPAFEVDPEHASATVVITDNDVAGEPTRIGIVAPKDGSQFAEGEAIRIEALAVDGKGFIARLEFFADDAKVGESMVAWPECVGCEPEPGDPARHVFEWKGAGPGPHELVAKATHRVVFDPAYEEQPLDPPAVSAPVWFAVGTTPLTPMLSIKATRPIAEESSSPYKRMPLTGEFLISRNGALNEPASVMLFFEGEAIVGEDCEPLPKELLIPAGQSEVKLEVKAIPDQAVEGPEKLIVRLLPGPSPVTPPVDIGIDPEHAVATVLICDDARCGQVATLEITSPKSGAQFPGGEAIELQAVAIDPLGTIYRVEFWAGEAQIGVSEIATLRAPEPGEPMQHAFVWQGPPAGVHVLTARAGDSTGAEVISPPVRILVEALPVPAFIERQLPQTYIPTQAFEVQLVAAPPQDASAWAVAERPPRGWPVGDISHDGVWDAAQGLVKFGPFTEPSARTLTYRITPPQEARGRHAFSGEAALDGRVVAIAGDRIIEPLNETHPADVQPNDFAIGLSEVTAYAAAWKVGATWPVGPVPIPANYVTRAGQIWRQGERYLYDPSLGAPPECWVPAAGDEKPGERQGQGARNDAERTLARTATPGASVEVILNISPGEAVESYALEEAVPAGWGFEAADHGAAYDNERGRLRWGPFYDAQPRRLTYRLKAPPDTASLGVFRGLASFDGRSQRILGIQTVMAQDNETAVSFRKVRREGGRLQLEIGGRPGQVCEVETSADLINWLPQRRLFVPEDGVVQIEDDASSGPARFFRIRPGGGE